MRLLALLGVALAALPAAAQPAAGTPPASPPAEEPGGPVGGEIRTDGATSEILPEPPPVGQTVTTPEGWYRVEAAPARDTEATGSLSVVPAAVFAPPAPPAAPAPAGARAGAAPAAPPATAAAPAEAPAVEVSFETAPVEDPCRDEKDRYLARLLDYLEIRDVEHPLSLLEGIGELPAGTGLGPFVRLSLFGIPGGGPVTVDPVRPLAWDLELRSIARDLAACVETNRGR